MDCGIWAKFAQGDWGTKLRVGTALTLLIGAKVIDLLSLRQPVKSDSLCDRSSTSKFRSTSRISSTR